MSVNALDFHRDERDWMEEDGEFFDCLEDRLSYLLHLTVKEHEEFLGCE